MKLVIGLILLTTLAHSGQGIRCYMCSSLNSVLGHCHDPFGAPPKMIQECKGFKTCTKTAVSFRNVTTWSRGCSDHRSEEQFCADLATNVAQLRGKVVDCKVCNKKVCNSAAVPGVALLLLFLSLFTTLLVRN